jgi:hypothetical protein
MEGLPIPRSEASEIARELVKDVISKVSSLQEKANARETPVCFVLDGEPLPAKALTHKSRAARSRGCLKKARKLARLFLAKPITVRMQNETKERFCKEFQMCASGWVRWFGWLKDLMIEGFQLCGASHGFDSENPANLSVVTAAFEADPKAVEICHRMGSSLLFSNDGDLLVYPYADRSVVFTNLYLLCVISKPVFLPISHCVQRVMQVDWNTAKVTFTTKPAVLKSLGFLGKDTTNFETDDFVRTCVHKAFNS